MFLCVGTIEQKIGSRNIEDMRGLIGVMPVTTLLAVVGIVTMFLPPFGALLSKWMAVEASARLPLVVLMLAIGSALTMVFWGRWLGLLMTSVISEKNLLQEEQSGLGAHPSGQSGGHGRGGQLCGSGTLYIHGAAAS